MKKGFGNMSNDNGNEWRDSDTSDIRAIVYNTVEFTLTDPIVGGLIGRDCSLYFDKMHVGTVRLVAHDNSDFGMHVRIISF